MRKIEKNMVKAAFNNQPWHCDNTSTKPIDDTNCAVYLHGHEIAIVNSRTGAVMVNSDTLRQWPTVTTKSRLNALGANVYTRKHITYLDGIAVN